MTTCCIARSTRPDTDNLQEVLTKLEQWEKDWQMEFNHTKCETIETIQIARKLNPIRRTYELHGHQLTNATSGKYLGVTRHEKLLWNRHVHDVSKRPTIPLHSWGETLPDALKLWRSTVFRRWHVQFRWTPYQYGTPTLQLTSPR